MLLWSYILYLIYLNTHKQQYVSTYLISIIQCKFTWWIKRIYQTYGLFQHCSYFQMNLASQVNQLLKTGISTTWISNGTLPSVMADLRSPATSLKRRINSAANGRRLLKSLATLAKPGCRIWLKGWNTTLEW